MEFIKDIKVTEAENSSVTIEGEIPFAEVAKHRGAALAHLGKDIEIDGFRKGNVPENILVERIGEMALLGEMAERTLAKVYPAVVKEHKLDVIGYPQVNLTKLAPDNPLGFTATVAVVPEVTLPDFKAIAATENKNRAGDDVTDKEVEDQINDVLRQKVAYERMQELAQKKQEAEAAKKDMDGATELPTPESEAAKQAESEAAEEVDPEKLPLPELTDELVKTLGQPGQFENVEDFKKKLREHLEIQKKQDNHSAHRAAITDKIVEEAKMELPQVLIDAEMNQMFAQMEEDLARAQLKMDDYLSHMNKTKEDLVAEYKPTAEKRAKLQLVLNEIAKVEEVKPDQGELDHQVSHLLEQYKDADEARVRTYVASMLVNEAVMKMLEEQ